MYIYKTENSLMFLYLKINIHHQTKIKFNQMKLQRKGQRKTVKVFQDNYFCFFNNHSSLLCTLIQERFLSGQVYLWVIDTFLNFTK